MGIEELLVEREITPAPRHLFPGRRLMFPPAGQAAGFLVGARNRLAVINLPDLPRRMRLLLCNLACILWFWECRCGTRSGLAGARVLG